MNRSPLLKGLLGYVLYFAGDKCLFHSKQMQKKGTSPGSYKLGLLVSFFISLLYTGLDKKSDGYSA